MEATRARMGGGGGPDEPPGAPGGVAGGFGASPGCVLVADPGATMGGAGRGGENEGRGGAAGGLPEAPGPTPPGFCLSFMLRVLATLSKS